MRYGVCCSIEEAPAVLAAGFDYAECAAQALVAQEAGEWRPTGLAATYRQYKVEAANLFFPGAIRLFGPEATAWEPYVAALLPVAAEAGIQVLVIGSGGPRRAPEGEEAACEAAFVGIAGAIAAQAAPFGLTIAPESLRRAETNVGNDLATFAPALRAAAAGYCADAYHVLEETAGSPDWKAQIQHAPDHVHLARGGDRLAPRGDEAELRSFFGRLHEVGYAGRVSLECGRDGRDFSDWLGTLRKFA